jgi:hypothetical protein
MKTRNGFFILALCSFLLIPSVKAATIDLEGQTQLIERLERILSQMERNDSSWAPSNLRLADLLAERARLRFMKEIESGCQDCTGSVADRKKALGLYETILPISRPETKGVIYFQMGHLHQLAGNDKRALSLYRQILNEKNEKYSSDIRSRARTSLADLLFEKAQYKEAFTQYKLALQNPETANKGLIHYRMAWSEFNSNHLKSGIQILENLAASPELLQKQTEKGPIFDSGFQSDVLRDLATFYSRQALGEREIKKFQSLVPADQMKEMLLYFGGEANRLGQKRAAAQIYQTYLSQPNVSKEERLDAMILLTQTNYDKGQAAESLETFAMAAKAYQNTKCSENVKCLELQKQMKHYVTELHRSNKIHPDENILKAYQIYSQTFPNDTEMTNRGGAVADHLRKPELAVSLYHQAADAAKDDKLRDQALLSEISAAESAQNPAIGLDLREKAYRHYLQLQPKGSQSFQVRYQLAQVSYERKNYSQAASEFRVLALDKTGSSDLRKKSADLALDCLAIEKKDPEIETWAQEFAENFPPHRTEFEKISRKALINQVATITNNEKSSQSDLSHALSKLKKAHLDQASTNEQLIIFKNMLLLAEKVEDEKSLLLAVAGLTRISALSAEDKEDAYARAVGFFERKLDFKSAYGFALKMKFKNLKASDRQLRLGTLADLGGLSPQRHYKAALNLGLPRRSEASIRERLVLLSANPPRELQKHLNALSREPEVLSEVILLIYAQQKSLQGLNSIIASPSYQNLTAVKFIRNQSLLAKASQLSQKIAAHQMNMKSDRSVQKSIKERLNLLAQADKSLSDANRSRELSAQIVALNTLKRENERMAQDLLRLPVPAGLSVSEQAKYQQLLAQQTRPYQFKAQAAESKLRSLWNNDRFFNDLTRDFERSRTEIQSLLRYQIQVMADLTPEADLKSRLAQTLRESSPSQRELMAAREDVRANPQDLKQIEKLKNLETKIGHPLMSSYLQGRLNQIQREKVL